MEEKKEHKLLTKAQAAAALNVSASTIERLIKSSKLRAIRIGPKLIKIDACEVEKLMSGAEV